MTTTLFLVLSLSFVNVHVHLFLCSCYSLTHTLMTAFSRARYYVPTGTSARMVSVGMLCLVWQKCQATKFFFCLALDFRLSYFSWKFRNNFFMRISFAKVIRGGAELNHITIVEVKVASRLTEI